MFIIIRACIIVNNHNNNNDSLSDFSIGSVLIFKECITQFKDSFNNALLHSRTGHSKQQV